MIPQPLLQQAASSAVIVVPLGYGLARVTVTGSGHAVGSFLDTPAFFMARRAEGELETVGLWTLDGSTATACVSGAVRQCGPQLLWDTVEALAEVFDGEPAREDFRLTVTPTRQVVSYKGPDGHNWELPPSP